MMDIDTDVVGYMLQETTDVGKSMYEDMFGRIWYTESHDVQFLACVPLITHAKWIELIFDIRKNVKNAESFTAEEISSQATRSPEELAMFLSNMTHFTFDECRVTRHGPHFSIRLYA